MAAFNLQCRSASWKNRSKSLKKRKKKRCLLWQRIQSKGSCKEKEMQGWKGCCSSCRSCFTTSSASDYEDDDYCDEVIDNSDGVGPDDDLYGDYNEDDGDGGGDEQDQVFPSQLDGENFDEESSSTRKQRCKISRQALVECYIEKKSTGRQMLHWLNWDTKIAKGETKQILRTKGFKSRRSSWRDCQTKMQSRDRKWRKTICSFQKLSSTCHKESIPHRIPTSSKCTWNPKRDIIEALAEHGNQLGKKTSYKGGGKIWPKKEGWEVCRGEQFWNARYETSKKRSPFQASLLHHLVWWVQALLSWNWNLLLHLLFIMAHQCDKAKARWLRKVRMWEMWEPKS